LSTNDPSNGTVKIPVKLTAGGGSLALVPTSADFGQISVGTAATAIPIALTNTGNLSATVGFTQPANAAFTLAWTGAPAAVVVAPGATVPGLVAGFLPATMGSMATTAGITTAGEMCGTSPTTIGMTGTGSSSPVTVQPGNLDFGLVDCGAQAPAQTVTIDNTGTSTITFTATLATGSAYAVGPASGSIGAGASATLTVTPSAIPAASPVTPNGYGDVLTVSTTAAGDMPHAIPLRETAQGAILSQSAPNVGFGSDAVGTTATSQFTVSNTGNASATVSFATQTSVFAVTPQGQTVGGGGSYNAIVTFTPPAASAYTDTAAMSVAPGTALCAPLPAAAMLSGSGTITAVSVAPTNLDFGLVDCGSKGTPLTVTLQNNGSASFDWSAAVTTAHYGLSPKTGTIAAGMSATVTVTPAAIPGSSAVTPDLYADTLTVTTNATGDKPHTVAIHETAQGAILSFNPTLLKFGNVHVGQSAQGTFDVVNTGNATASVTLSLSGSPGFSLAGNSVNVAGGGGASTVTVTFTPQAGGALNATASAMTSTALCAALPSPVMLQGRGN
jgi:hypothetical protein